MLELRQVRLVIAKLPFGHPMAVIELNILAYFTVDMFTMHSFANKTH